MQTAGKAANHISRLLVPVILTLTLVFCMPAAPAAAAEDGLTWGPYLTGTTSTGTVINTRTAAPIFASVEYATEVYYLASSSYELEASDGLEGTVHHIPLTGLQPGTVYHYRLNYGGTATDDYHFRTFPASGGFTFIVYGDTQDQLPSFSQYERYQLVAERVAAEPDMAFVLHCGDLVGDGENITDWDRYFDVSRQLMAGTTVYPALGNHERHSDIYYEAFGVAPYYSFNCGDAHFTVLDSNNTGPAQTAWLGDDLDVNKPWKFVSFHHPMYTSDPNHFGGWLNLQEDWEYLLLNNSVEAVWNGHIHAYEHYLEQGIHYVVMGTGGGKASQLATEKFTGYQNSLENILAYARVTIDAANSTASVQVIRVADISADGTAVTNVYPPGTVYDTFTLTLPPAPEWDLNGDGTCNIGDVAVIGSHWGESGDAGWIKEDLNRDGVINIGDVAVLGSHWGDIW